MFWSPLLRLSGELPYHPPGQKVTVKWWVRTSPSKNISSPLPKVLWSIFVPWQCYLNSTVQQRDSHGSFSLFISMVRGGFSLTHLTFSQVRTTQMKPGPQIHPGGAEAVINPRNTTWSMMWFCFLSAVTLLSSALKRSNRFSGSCRSGFCFRQKWIVRVWCFFNAV